MAALRITAPSLSYYWKAAAKAATMRPRRLPAKRRKRKSGSLPWRLPRPMSDDELMWQEYWIFKAAGMLDQWFDLYKDVLNLEPSPIHAGPQ